MRWIWIIGISLLGGVLLYPTVKKLYNQTVGGDKSLQVATTKLTSPADSSKGERSLKNLANSNEDSWVDHVQVFIRHHRYLAGIIIVSLLVVFALVFVYWYFERL